MQHPSIISNRRRLTCLLPTTTKPYSIS
jgi:hypothetical protein